MDVVQSGMIRADGRLKPAGANSRRSSSASSISAGTSQVIPITAVAADTRPPSCGRPRPSARSSVRSPHTHTSAVKPLALSASTIFRLASCSPCSEVHASGHQIFDFGPTSPPQGCPGSIGITVRLPSEFATEILVADIGQGLEHTWPVDQAANTERWGAKARTRSRSR